jgi:hypothetical protein
MGKIIGLSHETFLGWMLFHLFRSRGENWNKISSETLPPLVVCRSEATKPIAGCQVKFQKSFHPLLKING